MRRAMIWAGLAGVLCFGVYAPAVQARECKGQADMPLVGLLQPPPCETCEETKSEIDELATLERERTPEQESHATADVKMTVERFLEGAGIAFEPEKLRSCDKFFTRPRQEEKAAIDAAKDMFCRTRPYNTQGNTLHPIEKAIPNDSFSYPSGHSAYGATMGFILAAMLPEKKAKILSRIADYAHSRMVAGVHFRSDVEAGKMIGAATAASLFADPDFRESFEGAKACVRSAVRMEEAAR